jgi:predicted Abi (CAAX) family protease
MEPLRLMLVDINLPIQVYQTSQNSSSYVDKINFKETKKNKGKAWNALAFGDISVSNGIKINEFFTAQKETFDPADWNFGVGAKTLLVHAFGGYDGPKGEGAPRLGLFTGHFSFGEATVAVDEFTEELRFNVVYKQIYVQNGDGVLSGSTAYHKYGGSFIDVLLK